MNESMRTFLRRATGAAIGTLRRFPGFAAFERARYIALERLINNSSQGRRAPAFGWLARHPHRVRESLEGAGNYKVIDLRHLDAETADFLRASGMSPEHLNANRFDEPSFTDDLARELARVAFQAECLATGRISLTCPYSGRHIESNVALMASVGQPIFYRFESGPHTFYLAVGREVAGYAKLYLFFPAERFVVLLDAAAWAWLGRGELDQFRAFLITNWRDVRRTWNKVANPQVCALIDHTHFAHQIWNVLTGVERLAMQGTTARLDRLLVTHEPLGPIDQLFPEIDAEKVVRIDGADLPIKLLRDRPFVLRIGGNRISDAVVARIVDFARKAAPPEVPADIAELRRRHWPILWVTVRTGNRTWVSQAAGMPGIIRRLHEAYPKLAVIIDGYALPLGQTGILPGQQRAIDAETRLVAQMMAGLGTSLRVHRMIGKPLYESVLYSQVVDAYFAHHGTLQNKIGWLANKPGIVHSNRETLAGIGGTRKYYPAYSARIGGVAPTYLPADAVTDVAGAVIPGNELWRNPLENYEVDVDRATRALIDLLASLPPRDDASGTPMLRTEAAAR